jgi:hypothetical protein
VWRQGDVEPSCVFAARRHLLAIALESVYVPSQAAIEEVLVGHDHDYDQADDETDPVRGSHMAFEPTSIAINARFPVW